MLIKNKKAELITGVDIGSTAIRVAVGQFVMDGKSEGELQIIGAAEAPSSGVSKGIINSIEEAISSVSHSLEQIERLIGMPIEHTWVGITGSHIISQESRGVISVSKTDGEISEEDMERAVEAARMVAAPLNYEIMHVIPRSFIVDGQSGIKDPLGMTGMRLEVNTQIIHGMSSHIKNVHKTIYRTGLGIDDIVLSVVATGDVVCTSRQKDLGVVVVNIGGSTTSMVVYEGGDIIHSAVLPLGSEHITNDLALGLRTSIDIAERVKLQYGNCVLRVTNKRDKITINGSDGEKDDVSLYYISEIIGARVSEILEKIDKELVSIGRSGLLPAGAVFTGGGAKINGLTDIAKNVLRLPVTLGYPIDVPSITPHSNDLSFVSAIGLVKWGTNVFHGGRTKGKPVVFNAANKMWSNLRKAGKWLMP
jgi:cell division protein FtsA